ncbi:hypothetical protein ACFST9_07870 [Hymenobacter monticola]|uniref:DoxX family protein n=1 Tax=Hymenobacter monticola TaxID=1705399 RepID=A0ABY4BAU3_9BACT|nr:hypothetical protein [Hymenobacter monticola]UOE33775.1 hypothetical protein MTP16_21970 [Hymenobacter monticola]
MLAAFARRWALLFVGLLALTVPFRYRVLPSVGTMLRPALETGLARLTGQRAALFSDSAGLWLYAGLLALGTALVAAALARLARRTPVGEARLWYALHTGAAGLLALHLLLYGFDKVFKSQFYLPEPNTLYTPLGQLSPDLAYWSVMGISRFYSVFAGLLEVLPGLLLLWGRTRLLGGLLAVGVLANVLALNIGFDISVKLWAGFLMGLAVLVAAPGLRTLYAGLVQERWAAPRRPRRPASWHGRTVGAVRGVLLSVLLLETAGRAVQSGIFDDDAAPRPPLHGAYVVRPERPAAASQPRRVFVHRRGYFITQDANDQLHSYTLRYAPGYLLLRDEAGRPGTMAHWQDSAGLHLRGTLAGDSVRWLVRPLPWQQLPLLQPGHWTADAE